MTSTLTRGAANLRQRLHGDRDSAFDRRLISPLVLGSVLNPVNSSIISVSLVPIGRAFGAPPAQTAWLVSALYLATAIGQPVVGKLVDAYGPKPLLLAGTAMTGTAGIIGTVAPNLAVLVVARVVLGFGTCAGYPAAMYLIRREADRTGQDSPAGVLTILAISNQTILVVGPSLGGLLIGLGGWRTTFAVNIPLAIACFVLAVRRLPRSTRGAGGLRQLDYAGIVTFAGTLASLLLFLVQPRVGLLWLVAVAAVAAGLFLFRELRCADPFIDVRVVGGNTPLMLTYARGVLIALISYSFLYGYTQWLEDGRGLSASHAGLVLLPLFAVAIGVSVLTGRRAEIRAKLLVGQATQVLACVLLLTMTGTSPIWLALVLMAVLGVPQGLNNLAAQNAVYYQADPARIAASSGLLRTFMYLGAIASSAAGGAFFGKTADTPGLHHLAVFMIAASALGLLITVVDRSLSHVVQNQQRTTAKE